MSHHTPVTIDPKELERAQTLWYNFTQALVYIIIAITITLSCLAFLFTG